MGLTFISLGVILSWKLLSKAQNIEGFFTWFQNPQPVEMIEDTVGLNAEYVKYP